MDMYQPTDSVSSAVTLGRTIGLEALADVFAEVNREGALAIAGLAMHGTRTTAL